MLENQKSPHALFVRWGNRELHAVGVPAIGAVIIAVMILALLGARWLGLT